MLDARTVPLFTLREREKETETVAVSTCGGDGDHCPSRKYSLWSLSAASRLQESTQGLGLASIRGQEGEPREEQET